MTPFLAAGTSATRDRSAITVPFSLVPGHYFLGAYANADNTVPELNTTNNASSPPVAIRVIGGAPRTGRPGRRARRTSGVVGGTLPVAVTLENVGALPHSRTFQNQIF